MSSSLHSLSKAEAAPNGAAERAPVVVERVMAPPTEDVGAYRYDSYEDEWNIQSFLGLLHRRRKIALGVFGSIMALSLASGIFTRPVYRSTAQVLIDSTTNSRSAQPTSDIPGFTSLLQGANSRSQDTEIELMQSRSIQTEALKRVAKSVPVSLQRPPIDALIVVPVKTTDIVTVSTSSTDPHFAQVFTNELCQVYLQRKRNESVNQYDILANYVFQQREKQARDIAAAGEALRRFKEQSGVTDIQLENAARVNRLKTFTDAYQQAQSELAAGRSQVGQLRNTAAGIPSAEIRPDTFVANPVLQSLRQDLATQQSKRDQLLQEFTPISPEVRTVDGQIARLRAQISREPRTEIGTSKRNINETRTALDQSIAQINAQNSANVARISALQSDITTARTSLLQLPAIEARLTQLQLQLQNLQQGYETLDAKYQASRISAAAPAGKSRVVSLADDAVKIKPKLSTSLALGLFLGALMSLLAALISDRLDNRVHSEDDVRSSTQLPILANIPRLPNFDSNSLVFSPDVQLGRKHGPMLESYRMLRTSLMFTVLDSPLRSILLTSSQPNEGKSSVAANLAASLALNGKTVLLIDGDLRRPSQHRILGLSAEKGFTNVVAGMCSLEDAIQDTHIENLKMLGVGPTPPNPAEMLDSRAARALFQQARGLADFVIIDAPPALMMADAQIIATEADGVLIVVSWEEALKNAVSRTCDIMARTGTKLLGVVVNKWDEKQSGYYNKYDQHYYSLTPGETKDGKKN